jgi:3-oxoacyl-[acyl-carrier-protein] synthase III
MACWPFLTMNGLFRRWRRKMSDNLTKRDQRDRSKINMHEDFEVKYWTKALGVSRDELQKAVDKVGNSAAAVRKELAA